MKIEREKSLEKEDRICCFHLKVKGEAQEKKAEG